MNKTEKEYIEDRIRDLSKINHKLEQQKKELSLKLRELLNKSIELEQENKELKEKLEYIQGITYSYSKF